MRSPLDLIQHHLRPIRRGLALMVGRALVRLVNDSGALQLMQADRLDGETADDLERFAEYGFSSCPKAGAELIVVSVAGVRSHGVVIASEDRRFRLKNLAEGEVALYDDLGQVVHLKRDGLLIESPLKVDVQAPEVTVTANSVTIDADSASFTGNVSIEGDLDLTGAATLGDGASKFVKLADDSAATKVKAK